MEKSHEAGLPVHLSKAPQFKSYQLNNFRDIPQLERLSEQQKFDIEVVGNVLPFKVNNYVIDHLIDWDSAPDDPIFALTFPQKDMLCTEHYDEMAALLKGGADKAEIRDAANRIRMQLNPHPAGQADHNVPLFEGEPLRGVQHKYRQTVLFFPSQSQTCHAYCTFCFRWPQFIGLSDIKFASREVEKLVSYLRQNPAVTDILFTGGDPMIMSAKNLAGYIEPLLQADLPNLVNIRIGTKVLAYWPHKFVDDSDAEEMLALFRKVTGSGRQLALMAHFNHPRELEGEVVRQAIRNLREAGCDPHPVAGDAAHQRRPGALGEDVAGAGQARLHTLLHVPGARYRRHHHARAGDCHGDPATERQPGPDRNCQGDPQAPARRI